MEALKQGSDVLFILLGGIMILAMHAGFAFLELGTVRKKNQVNALVKILVDFAVSTIAYFFVGYGRLRHDFFGSADTAGGEERLRTGEVLLPADLRGGDPGDHLRRHRRARQVPSADGATAVLVGLVYPLFEGVAWNHASASRTGSRPLRRGVPRLRRLGRGARGGRLGRAAGGAAAGRAQRPLPQGRRGSPRTRRRTSPSWRWAPGS
jgi:hypothetical protein